MLCPTDSWFPAIERRRRFVEVKIRIWEYMISDEDQNYMPSLEESQLNHPKTNNSFTINSFKYDLLQAEVLFYWYRVDQEYSPSEISDNQQLLQYRQIGIENPHCFECCV